MIESIEQSFLLLLKDLDARSYTAQFEDKSTISALFTDHECLVFLDFLGSERADIAREKVRFKLYACARTAAKDPQLRREAKFRALNAIAKADELLINHVPACGFMPVLEAISKEFEDASEMGYVALYSRTFSALVSSVEFLGESDEV